MPLQVLLTFYYKTKMDINYYLLQKFGWKKVDSFFWHRSNEITSLLHRKLSTDHSRIILTYFENDLIYCLVGFSENEKQLRKEKYNSYQFLAAKIVKDDISISPKVNVYSNLELISLIRENLACNLTYKRLFQINSIIK